MHWAVVIYTKTLMDCLHNCLTGLSREYVKRLLSLKFIKPKYNLVTL